mmetsp:Transcript_12201/g.32849  ORF Transcript_12201/g.32849 Transcript_12201/m.32849 type:complete len:413 (-) Transcript_12201:7-1245(-)
MEDDERLRRAYLRVLAGEAEAEMRLEPGAAGSGGSSSMRYARMVRTLREMIANKGLPRNANERGFFVATAEARLQSGEKRGEKSGAESGDKSGEKSGAESGEEIGEESGEKSSTIAQKNESGKGDDNDESSSDGTQRGGFHSVCSLRGLVWKALLGLARPGAVRVSEYLALVGRGPSSDADKIAIDVVRTFNSNAEFISSAPPNALARVLNAYTHARGNAKGCYVQSMSLLLAPFMLSMPEADAYFAFSAFLETHAPRYVREQYAGVHDGFRLLEAALEQTDRELYVHLTDAHEMSPELYAFSIVSTLNVVVPPLQDTVKLWDIVIAFGAHWGGVLFTLARLVNSSALLRDDDARRATLGARAKPLFTRELEAGLNMSADAAIASAARLAQRLPADLRRAILLHPIVPLPPT